MDVVLLFMLHVQARRRRQEELEKQRQEEQLRKQQVILQWCSAQLRGVLTKARHVEEMKE
jgi:hypothetical protein